MEEELIADVPNEGDAIQDNAFEKSEDAVEETTPESQPEKKQTEKPTQGGEPEKDNTPEEKTPFHKHPRWIAQRKENEALKAQVSELSNKFKDVEPLLKERQAKELPEFWKKAYGDTPESRQSYQNYEEATKAERERIKQEVLDEFKRTQQEEVTTQQKADEYVKTQLAEMKDEGLDFKENELMKFVVDFTDKYGEGSLLDAEGNYDLRKSLELMSSFQVKTQDASTETKKRLASDTMRSKVASTQKSDIPVISTRSLRRGTWRDAV